jgi:hypothetical protein
MTVHMFHHGVTRMDHICVRVVIMKDIITIKVNVFFNTNVNVQDYQKSVLHHSLVE